jgi:pyruvate/2-oxoglutarate dehydrogenase complex dihydrolipoamide acyltransferase (E2) component
MRLAAVTLPELGTGLDIPIVVSHWYAIPGELVWEGDRLVELLVGPATYDVPAPATGRLKRILQPEESQVLTGTILGYVAVREDSGHSDAPGETA